MSPAAANPTGNPASLNPTAAALPHLLPLPALIELSLGDIAGLTGPSPDKFEETNEQIQVNR